MGGDAASAVDAHYPPTIAQVTVNALRWTVEVRSGNAGDDSRFVLETERIGLPLRGAARPELGRFDERPELLDQPLLHVIEALIISGEIEEDFNGLPGDDDPRDQPTLIVGIAKHRDAVPLVVGEHAENNRRDDLLAEHILRKFDAVHVSHHRSSSAGIPKASRSFADSTADLRFPADFVRFRASAFATATKAAPHRLGPMPRSPLPPREGISATALRAPGGKATHAKNHLPVPDSIGEWLESEFPEAAPESRRALLTDGDLRDEAGHPVTWDDPVIPGGFYFFHRPVPPEERIPFEVGIVFEDDDLLVVDKPHFLASTPNGRFVRECVVTRLRVDLDQPDLVAIHRLDRITAGLLVLSKRPETRGRYQRLFQDRKVHKTYRALASAPPADMEFPLVRESRLVKPVGGRQVLEVEGEPNAISRIRLLRTITSPHGDTDAAGPPRRGDTDVEPRDRAGGEDGAPPRRGVAEYELEPVTGKTHQLRVHMNALGLPVLGDPVYPVDLAPDPYDFTSPLQLLAAEIAFDDPLTGLSRRFESGLELDPAAVSSDPGETR